MRAMVACTAGTSRRKLTSKGANIFADTMLRPGVSDLTGSFRLYKRPVLEKLFESTDVRGFSMQMALAVTARRRLYNRRGAHIVRRPRLRRLETWSI